METVKFLKGWFKSTLTKILQFPEGLIKIYRNTGFSVSFDFGQPYWKLNFLPKFPIRIPQWKIYQDFL